MNKIFTVFLLGVIYGCANITTPTGGPKDFDPPELVSSVPENKQINFKGKTIELIFNEDVKLNNPKDEIIISPSPGKEIEFKVKGRRVTITPENGWKDSTTYSLLFRDGIKDITEGNSPTYLKLAFSTGADIDSLRFSGRVEDILKGTSLEKITVAIYQQDTFDIFSDAPEYFTKSNKSGRFSLENIKAGDYKIYAFEDKNKNLKVDSRTERYGFLSGKQSLSNHIDSLSIGMIMLDSRKLKINSIRTVGAINRLRFNKYITEYKIKSDSDLVSAFGDNQTELNIWCPDGIIKDSLQISISAKDSLDFTVDSVFYVKRTERAVRETFKFSFDDPRVDSETGKFSTTIKFNKPLAYINFDSIFIELDTINKVQIEQKDFIIDEPHKEIAFRKDLNKKIFKAEEEPLLKLTARQGFLLSIESDTSKKSSANIITYWPERTGILLVQVNTTEKDYIIQLINGQKKVVSSISNQPKYSFKNLNPEEYQIRIIVDSNKNGKWDPGNIFLDKEPEKVFFYTTSDGKKRFPIRANWELGPLHINF